MLYFEGVFFFLFRVKEVCILLNFLLGFVVLLRDLFKLFEIIENEREGDFLLSVVLKDIGVYRLIFEDVLKVFDLRIYLFNVKWVVIDLKK